MTTPQKALPSSHVAAQFTPPLTPQSIHLNQTAAVPSLPAPNSTKKASLIKVHAASLNPVDHKISQIPLGLSSLLLGNPSTPATDFVGRIWWTNASGLKAGDWVYGTTGFPGKYGTCAEFTVVNGDKNILPVPADFVALTGDNVEPGKKRSMNEFAGIGVAAQTALQCLKAGGPVITNGGGKVFVNGGSGGVGTFAVQMAKHGYKCSRVVASCSGANADLVKSLGADEVVDYKQAGSGGLADMLKKSGEKFDLIVDGVGNDLRIYRNAHNYTTSSAPYVQVGGGFSLGEIYTMARTYLQPSFLGGGQRKYQFLGLMPNKEDLGTIGKWMAEGKVKCVVEDQNVFPLAQTAKAFERLLSGRTRGKIIVEVADSEF